jgi:hypothetical protein
LSPSHSAYFCVFSEAMLSSGESDLISVAKLIVLNRRLRILAFISLIFGVFEVVAAFVLLLVPLLHRTGKASPYFWDGQPYIDLTSYLIVGASALVAAYRRSVGFIRCLLWSIVVFTVIRLIGLFCCVMLFEQKTNLTPTPVKSSVLELVVPIGAVLVVQYPFALAFFRTAKEIADTQKELLSVEYDDEELTFSTSN